MFCMEHTQTVKADATILRALSILKKIRLVNENSAIVA